MKKLEAIIRTFKLQEVTVALVAAGVSGVTATEVRGFGRQKGHVEVYRSREFSIDFVPKVKVEVVVPDELIPQALEALEAAARCGRVGDGKLYFGCLETVVRIRTGERGGDAL